MTLPRHWLETTKEGGRPFFLALFLLFQLILGGRGLILSSFSSLNVSLSSPSLSPLLLHSVSLRRRLRTVRSLGSAQLVRSWIRKPAGRRPILFHIQPACLLVWFSGRRAVKAIFKRGRPPSTRGDIVKTFEKLVKHAETDVFLD